MQETLKELQPMLVTAAQEVQKIVATVEKESLEVAEVEKVVKVDEEAALVSISFICLLVNHFELFMKCNN